MKRIIIHWTAGGYYPNASEINCYHFLIDKEGKIVSFEKVKTHRKAVERAIQIFDEFIGDSKKGKIYVVHTVREDDAKELAKYIDSKYPGFETEIQMITPAVGAHIGYGVLGIAGFVLDKYNK